MTLTSMFRNMALLAHFTRNFFYYASIRSLSASTRSLSLRHAFLGYFFDIGSTISRWVLRLSNIIPGGGEARVVGRNTMQKRDKEKNFKNLIIGSIITSKDFLSVKIHK